MNCLRFSLVAALLAWALPSPSRANNLPEPPLPPSQFNPDPGGAAPVTVGPIPLFPSDPVLPPDYGSEPLPPEDALPRRNLFAILPFLKKYDYRRYDPAETARELPPNAKAVPNRWWIGFGQWKRYHDPSTETPYQYETPLLYHPYRQSTLKGDAPIFGQDLFLNLTLKNFSLFEYRKLPTPSGVSAAQPNSSEFFGRSEQVFFSNDTSISFDFFQGETTFKPVEWALHFTGVYNVNVISVRENNQIDPDPRGVGYNDTSRSNPAAIGAGKTSGSSVNPVYTNGNSANLNPGDLVDFLKPYLRNAPNDLAHTRYTTRLKDFFALQEAYAEIHLLDLSPNYDFISSRFGIQPFTSDFRGFIFSDSNLGVRVFGNAANNLYQYNFVYFDMREKDTYSDLNTFDPRDQHILIANLYKQDFLAKGYTAQWSLHLNIDNGDTHFDKNDFITRPALLGDARPHSVDAVYLGWAGDGHLGRLNLTHAFYQVLGQDEFNGLAGRRVDINAQMAALELSYDHNWIRFKASGFYASGDSRPTDGTARGFDSIQDSPAYIGGPFSWYAHEGINLAGTTVNLKQRDSLVPDFRTSKSEGQSNFVNPGVEIVGVGPDLDVTSELRA